MSRPSTTTHRRRADIVLRQPTSEDAAACGRIIYDAFKGIAERHGYEPDFASVDMAIGFAKMFIGYPAIFGVVAEADGRVVGSNFLDERDAIRGVGPITVDPQWQRGGVGRQLMQAVLERGRGAAGIRLLQDAHNMTSLSLYASLGFDVREPMMLMRGTPADRPPAGLEVRPMRPDDLDACAALCTRVHGFARANELRDAIAHSSPFVAVREARVVGYASAPTLWVANHGVAESQDDLRGLLAGVGAVIDEPLWLLVPTRQTDLLRWCLRQGLRGQKSMTLMTIGAYQDPRGGYFPSVAY